MTFVPVFALEGQEGRLFQPLAYQVATGALAAGEVCYPLRAIFRELISGSRAIQKVQKVFA